MTSPVVHRVRPKRGDWAHRAACLGLDDELFFPDPLDFIQAASAKGVCAVCPVRADCLGAALRAERGQGGDSRFGIFGGLDPDERAELDGYSAHGSYRAYRRHLAVGTPVCEACQTAYERKLRIQRGTQERWRKSR